MTFNYFADNYPKYPFSPLGEGDDKKTVVENLDLLLSLLEKLDNNAVLGIKAETLLFPIQSGRSYLGTFEDTLKRVGEIAKEKRIRLCSIFDDPQLGLASASKEIIARARAMLISHVEFMELCHLDYNSLVFIPFGGTYLCNYEKFSSELDKLPMYIRHRVGIFDRSNLLSMIIASNHKLPWLFNCADEQHSSEDYFKSAVESFKGFSINPNMRPMILTPNKGLVPSFIQGYEIDIISNENPSDLPKVRLKNGASSNIPRKSVPKDRKNTTPRA